MKCLFDIPLVQIKMYYELMLTVPLKSEIQNSTKTLYLFFLV